MNETSQKNKGLLFNSDVFPVMLFNGEEKLRNRLHLWIAPYYWYPFQQ